MFCMCLCGSFYLYFSTLDSHYKLKNKYLASASLRNDGSSKFGKENRYGWFPAFSAGWLLNEEDFLKDLSYLSFLKLRGSYGYTGNANIGDFASLGYYTTGGGYNGKTSTVPTTLANPNLHWEKCAQLDVNLDYGFYNRPPRKIV